jgi:glyoxylate reductase
MFKVLWTNAPPPDHYAPLRDLAEVVTGPPVGAQMLREEVLARAGEVDAIVNQAELRVDRELLDAAPRLKAVANVAIGTNNLDTAAMLERGVIGLNVPDAFAESTADATIGLLLAVARRLPEADRYVRSGRWPEDGFQPGVWDGMELSGKTLGIFGFGLIGKAVARRAEAFGMKVRFHTRSPADDPRAVTFHELLETSDALSLHAPLTDKTTGLLERKRLARMKRGAILLNLARGQIVEEAALVEALRTGQLGGVGLDVFADEPQVPASLTELSNVVLTPHLGGGTRESRKRARLAAAEDVARVLRGEPPRHSIGA